MERSFIDLTEDNESVVPPVHTATSSSSAGIAPPAVVLDSALSLPKSLNDKHGINDALLIEDDDDIDDVVVVPYMPPRDKTLPNINQMHDNSNNNMPIFVDLQTDDVPINVGIYMDEDYLDDNVMDYIDKYHNPVNDIMQIFPEATRSGIENLLKTHCNNTQSVISYMMEHSYEKDKKKIIHNPADCIEYNSISSFAVSGVYKRNAETQIQNDFPYLKLSGLRILLASKNYHYYPTLLALEELSGQKAQFHCLDRTTVPAVKNGTHPRIVLRPMLHRKTIEKLASKGLPNKQTIRPLYHQEKQLDPIFVNEMEFVWKKKQEIAAAEAKLIQERERDEKAAVEGTLIECGCCCADVAFENAVQCSEGHLFCKMCLQRYVEETIFGTGRIVIKCMNTTEACEGFFMESMLQMSLPDKILQAYNSAVAKETLKSAQVKNLVSCRVCNMQVEMPETAGSVLVCSVCNAETCRHCGEDNHIPLRCNEVEKKAVTNSRLKIEEAMTAARVRECHKCKTRFYKTEGCNKMTCSCGALMCYICRKAIKNYAHFCQTAHCNHKTCGKCKLFTDSIEDDRLAMRDAGVKAVEEAKESGADLSNLNVADLLEGGPPKKKSKNR